MEMPDGRVVEPGDSITWSDLCALMPYLSDAMYERQAFRARASRGIVPGQSVTLPGMQPNGMSPIAAPDLFGQAGGQVAQYGGAGGFVASGGGGGQPGKQGVPGVRGDQGIVGPGADIDFIVKTDGDFEAAAGAFIPVPGTSKAFTTTEAGAALFFVQATLGCDAKNTQIGIRVDGVDHPLTGNLIVQSGGGESAPLAPGVSNFPVELAAGAHTMAVILRGLPVSVCGGSGLGTVGKVKADADFPLALSVIHK